MLLAKVAGLNIKFEFTPEGSWSSHWSYKDLLNTCAITTPVQLPKPNLQRASPMQYLIGGRHILKRKCTICHWALVFFWPELALEEDIVVCEFTHFRFINTNFFVGLRNTKAENFEGEPMHGTQDNPLHIKFKRNGIREDCQGKVQKLDTEYSQSWQPNIRNQPMSQRCAMRVG